jgi:hypothetical protein
MSGPRGAGEPRLILSANLTRMVAGGALLSAAVRGVDYLLLPQNSEGLTVVEEAAPITVWGAGLLIGAVLACAGWIRRCWPLGICGHFTLAGIYVGLGVGNLTDWPADIAGVGLREGISAIGIKASLHLVLALAAWQTWDAARE